MNDYILSLYLIVAFGIITDLVIIIKKRNVITIENMGIDVLKKCPDLNINMINNKKIFKLKDMSGIILFIEEDCITCQTIVNAIETSEIQYDILYAVVVGGEENAVRFIENHNSWKNVGFLDKGIIMKNLNISAFPFFMLLKDGTVIEKGFPAIETLIKAEV